MFSDDWLFVGTEGIQAIANVVGGMAAREAAGLPPVTFEQTGMVVGVEDASFSVHAGEIFVVMGFSGSGKSTLLRMLNRLVEPTFGQVFIQWSRYHPDQH